MQEQKRYQIEKVITEVCLSDLFFTTHYYPVRGVCATFGFNTEEVARMSAHFVTGIWRIKQQNLKQSKN